MTLNRSKNVSWKLFFHAEKPYKNPTAELRLDLLSERNEICRRFYNSTLQPTGRLKKFVLSSDKLVTICAIHELLSFLKAGKFVPRIVYISAYVKSWG